MRLFFLLVLFAFGGCRQMATMVSPYRIDIQQGNVVTQEMVAKLKPGMSRSQVRFALGSPLIVDPFRTDRWDYVYTYQRQGKDIETRRLIVVFQDDKMLRIEGEALPQDPVAGVAAKSGRGTDSSATARAEPSAERPSGKSE
jgi:outer membrane protein assembly factor BamE